MVGLAQGWGHRGYGRVKGSRLGPQGGGLLGVSGLIQLPLCPATPCHPSADQIHPPIQLPGDSRCRLLS